MNRVCTAALAILAPLASALATEPSRGAKVEAIEVRLFLQRSGTFSEPLPEGATLWNTVIGEGAAGEPSSSTLVKVLVTGQPNSYQAHAKVQLKVQATGRKPHQKILTKNLGHFGPEGRQFVGFWLATTGCEPLTISAQVLRSRAVVQHRVPFACGE
jgi:hypothetical protein